MCYECGLLSEGLEFHNGKKHHTTEMHLFSKYVQDAADIVK
jgi:hypothetical protein